MSGGLADGKSNGFKASLGAGVPGVAGIVGRGSVEVERSGGLPREPQRRASSQYDIPELVRNSYGPLFDNRPHQVKIDGFYSFDLRSAGRFTVGASLRYQSGTPISIYADNNRYSGQYLVYVLPRGAGGRIEPTYYANLSLSYAYPLREELELELTARLANLTNNKAVLRVDETYSFAFGRAIAGGDLEDLKHSKVQSSNAPTSFFQRGILPRQGNFGVQTVFQQPIQAQFELRLRF